MKNIVKAACKKQKDFMNADPNHTPIMDETQSSNESSQERTNTTVNRLRTATPQRPMSSTQIHRNTSYRRVLAGHSSYAPNRPIGTPETYNSTGTWSQYPTSTHQNIGTMFRQSTQDTMGDEIPSNDLYRQDLGLNHYFVDTNNFNTSKYSSMLDKTQSIHSVTTSNNKQSNASLNSLVKEMGDTSAGSYKVTPRNPVSLNYSKRAKKYCCCFKTRCGCCTFWLLFLLILFVGLAVTGYFLYPRLPTVQVSATGNRVDAMRYNGSTFTASPSSPFIITFGLNLSLVVDSKNYIDWDLSYIQVEGNLLDSNGTINPYINGTGRIENIVIKNFASTAFVIPINVSYYLTVPITDISREPNIQTLLDACGVSSGSSPSGLTLYYQVTVGVKLIEWTRYTPKFSGTASFPCPIPTSAWEEIISKFSLKNMFPPS